jgi:hypothetical protein
MPGSGASIATIGSRARGGWRQLEADHTMSCVTNSAVCTPTASGRPPRPPPSSLVVAIDFDERLTHAGRDNHVVFDECARQMTPCRPLCETVQHDDRWTMPADAYVDLGAVGSSHATAYPAGRVMS